MTTDGDLQCMASTSSGRVLMKSCPVPSRQARAGTGPHREMPVMQCTSTLASFSLLTPSAAAGHHCQVTPASAATQCLSEWACPGVRWWHWRPPRKSKHSWNSGGEVLTVW